MDKERRVEGEVCTCDFGYEEHSCPFQLEIHDDDTPCCRCCPYCEQQCADEI